MKFTKETLKRAARTFFQAALSYLLVTLASGEAMTENSEWKTLLTGLLLSSCAAGLAAVMNLEKDDEDDLQSVC